MQFRATVLLLCAIGAVACTRQLELDVLDADAGSDATAGANGGTAAGGTGGAAQPDLANCPLGDMRDLLAEPGEPSLMLVVNRSTSMLAPLGDRTKLEAVARSVPRVLANRRLAVGLVQFPGPAPSCASQVACCASPVVVAPRADGGRSIQAVLSCEVQALGCFETSNAVPIAAALNQVRMFFSVVSAGQERAALLVTDADPQCASARSEDCEDAVLEAAALAQQKIPAHVLAITNDGAACLKRLAEAGQTRAIGDAWADARSEAAVESAFEQTVSEVEQGFCRTKLRFSPRQQEAVRVFVDGSEILRGQEAGGTSWWAFERDSSTRLRVFGEICTTLKRRPLDVRVVEGCCRTVGRDCR